MVLRDELCCHVGRRRPLYCVRAARSSIVESHRRLDEQMDAGRVRHTSDGRLHRPCRVCTVGFESISRPVFSVVLAAVRAMNEHAAAPPEFAKPLSQGLLALCHGSKRDRLVGLGGGLQRAGVLRGESPQGMNRYSTTGERQRGPQTPARWCRWFSTQPATSHSRQMVRSKTARGAVQAYGFLRRMARRAQTAGA